MLQMRGFLGEASLRRHVCAVAWLRNRENARCRSRSSAARKAKRARGCGEGGVVRTASRRSVVGRIQATTEGAPSRFVAPQVTTEGEQQVTLYYRTSWQQPKLHYSFEGSTWEDAAFTRLLDSQWHTLTLGHEMVDGSQANAAPFLQFVITDQNGSWEKPKEGGNYEIATSGVYSVQGGVMESAALKPVMVVSDLDGTMVGNDAFTLDFRKFWGRHSAFTKSTLVYNTGRSLESFLQLLEEKRNCLEIPDMLISAVGTKIYQNEAGAWSEDDAWMEQLDEGWNLESVKEAAQSALDAVGSDAMHFRPDNEQNEHKLTCGVKKASLDEVVHHLEAMFNESEVQANVISSGIGEWRFLDIVSKNAGKLEALNYVRKKFGFSEAETVACGDSGNDILMLSGQNLAIVVGNAQPDLLEWLKEEPRDDGDRIYLADQSEAHGILEGLKKFGFY